MPRILHQTVIIVCCLIVSLLLAWKLLASINYGYTFWYDQLSIESHIAKFAPQNRQGKTGFEHTDRATREKLFNNIGLAINHGGAGLRELSYAAAPNTSSQAEAAVQTLLLTDAEATHLEDVANLIDVMMPVGWSGLAILLTLLIIGWQRRWPLPGLRTSLLTLLALALLIAAFIVVMGADDIFSALHEAVFPAEHQWFFYYQDSLMTTLMKAPDIFFAIGAAWGALSALCFLLLSSALRWLDKTRIH